MTYVNGLCECCNQKKPLVGVACIPGIPMSIAWCRECLEADVIPYWAAVSNTACCMLTPDHDVLHGTNEEWKALVTRSLAYHKKTMEQFEKDVRLADAEMQQYDSLTQNGTEALYIFDDLAENMPREGFLQRLSRWFKSWLR